MKKTSALSGINTQTSSAASFSHCKYSLYMLQLSCDFYNTFFTFNYILITFFSLSIFQLLVKD